MKILNPLLLVITSISLLAVSGCSSTSSRAVLPEQGPTMVDVYKQKMEGINAGENMEAIRSKARAGIAVSEDGNYGYTRTAHNEITHLFPKLPNPTLVLYVYPHLAGNDEAPVPGYSTAFTFYKEDHYALPGEVNKRGYY